jgi:ABC-type multidrug transport system fused ATPase/permease subunit
LVEEVLNGIKYIKMSGWERLFVKKFEKAADKEVDLEYDLDVKHNYNGLTFWVACALFKFIVFIVYIYTVEKVDAKDLYAMISAIGELSWPFIEIPYVLKTIRRLNRSRKRLLKYMQSEEIDKSYIKHIEEDKESEEFAIDLQDGNFYWKKQQNSEEEEKKKKEEEKLTGKKAEDDGEDSDEEGLDKIPTFNKALMLKDLNLKIKKGSLVVVLGDIGAGKSSLLNALIGEMNIDPLQPPQLRLNGTLAFLNDSAWILNKTVKENITLDQEFDEKKYKEVIKYAAMERDIEIFKEQDQTLVGERGTTLSGGQKARLSLARALYFNRDILLMDDPLSAVDAEVGHFLLNDTICGYLRNKTRVLVTHKIEAAKVADDILILKDGRIQERLNKESLLKSELYLSLCNKFKNKKSSSD